MKGSTGPTSRSEPIEEPRGNLSKFTTPFGHGESIEEPLGFFSSSSFLAGRSRSLEDFLMKIFSIFIPHYIRDSYNTNSYNPHPTIL